ncbi:MAG: hypothetical protein ACRDPC_07455 [Solirubrobacteraceae bacterium]
MADALIEAPLHADRISQRGVPAGQHGGDSGGLALSTRVPLRAHPPRENPANARRECRVRRVGAFQMGDRGLMLLATTRVVLCAVGFREKPRSSTHVHPADGVHERHELLGRRGVKQGDRAFRTACPSREEHPLDQHPASVSATNSAEATARECGTPALRELHRMRGAGSTISNQLGFTDAKNASEFADFARVACLTTREHPSPPAERDVQGEQQVGLGDTAIGAQLPDPGAVQAQLLVVIVGHQCRRPRVRRRWSDRRPARRRVSEVGVGDRGGGERRRPAAEVAAQGVVVGQPRAGLAGFSRAAGLVGDLRA